MVTGELILNLENLPLKERYDAALSGVKKYEDKINSRLVRQLKNSDPIMWKKQYYALMLHKYRTLLVYGFLRKGIWEDEVTKGWDYSNLVINL